ncbi:hypothetical protein PR048_021141 [Dryococelus australis]|uniref:Integrase catalytic domain-containing protein n=1 Tax=Dryococelus australis TaxID=614101 RepID=A0ABQ9GXE3_9NEOP|nr:hypothetical protein PR048_021141 [Dryococelus australis]
MLRSDSGHWTQRIDMAYPMPINPIWPPLLCPRKRSPQITSEGLKSAFRGDRFCNWRVGAFSRGKTGDFQDCYVHYKNLVQNQSVKKMKEILCDNGREYINKDVYRFVKEEGIYSKPVPTYIYELNGVTERYNKTIMDPARCLISEPMFNKRFRMKDLGKVKQCLAICIKYCPDDKKICLSQVKYFKSHAKKSYVKDSWIISTPMESNLKLESADKGN